MNKNQPPGEEVAAIDALFERGLLPDVPPPPDTGPALPGPAEQPEVSRAERLPPPAGPTSPLRDYLRELQEEYDREQEKGKL